MVLPVAHRTLFGAQAEHLPNWPLSGFPETRSAIIHRTCPVSQRNNSQMSQQSTAKGEQCAVRSQSGKSERTEHVWCATGLSGAARRQKTSMVNRSKPQRSADVVGTGQ
jgi:hypothetical protein